MDRNGKKKISDLEKKILSSSKTGESVGNAKQTIYNFLARGYIESLFKIQYKSVNLAMVVYCLKLLANHLSQKYTEFHNYAIFRSLGSNSEPWFTRQVA